jgi:hypothetical protein
VVNYTQYAYIDAMKLFSQQQLGNTRITRLQRHSRTFQVYPVRFRPNYEYIFITQPDTECLIMVDDLIRRKVINLFYLELAYDILVDTRCIANQLKTQIDGLLDDVYVRRLAITTKTVRYTRARRSTSNFVTYADLPFRFDGLSPCTHLEWRVRGRAALTRLRIKRLATFDVKRAITTHLRFAEPDLQKFRRTVPHAGRILRIAQEEDIPVSAQGFRMICRGRVKPSNFMRQITLDEVINALNPDYINKRQPKATTAKPLIPKPKVNIAIRPNRTIRTKLSPVPLSKPGFPGWRWTTRILNCRFPAQIESFFDVQDRKSGESNG